MNARFQDADEPNVDTRPASSADAASATIDRAVDLRMATVDREALRAEFVRQGAFIYVPPVLPADVTRQLAVHANALLPELNRNYLPGHKKGGSVSRHTIDRLAPMIAQLYRSKPLITMLEELCGERLQICPPDDPHAYALYYYTRPGDHIGWHYDTSYYEGRRYTLLVGVMDNSSCRLDYELHTREEGVTPVPGTVQIPPGGLVFFDGDKLRHRITPLSADEMRVSLTFEYVTDPGMRPGRRLLSNLKDAFAYFGFRQLLRGRKGPGPAK